MHGRPLAPQLLRFGVVGLASNAGLYLAFLGLLAAGVPAVAAMTGLYVTGVLLTFALQRRWTFRHGGHATPAFRRYVVLQVLGYLLNLGLLVVLAGRLDWPAAGVQALAIFLVAGFLFAGQRYWVFRHREAQAGVARNRGGS